MKTTIKTVLIMMAASFISPSIFSQETGIFKSNTDIGDVKHQGSALYQQEDQTYILAGSGKNIWFEQDELQYVYKKIKGDFILRAHIRFLGDGVDPHRKIGWMIRESLESKAAHASAVVHGDGLASLQYRKKKGFQTEEVRSKDQAPDIIQLERKDNNYIFSTAKFGELFTSVNLSDLGLSNEVYVGLFICSHNEDVVEKAVFSNVRIVVPAPDNLQQYRDYLGSHLEVMDIETGLRSVLHSYTGSFQAPNWTTDGNALIYSQEGLLYRFDLETNTPTPINTGFAKQNNNDHVLSFDGSMLAISDHSKHPEGQSQVYILPIEGGTPELITEKAPSYLHGWSTDGTKLVFTGQRNSEYDIYKIDTQTKTETRLTDAPGLDDGPEYSPDGKYIYFNSSRTGTMQLYRMRPDGSEQEQLTFDEYNDWFPHISPDGKWIVYISFPPEVEAGSHPFYKRVYLRLLPTKLNAKPKVIAYLYGGQGTINVPSWSPDSKRIAFVSNTKMEE